MNAIVVRAVASPSRSLCSSVSMSVMWLLIRTTTADRFLSFWSAQTVFLARLYRSPLITIAAIRGACPAGGCILSLCCDYRIMTREGNPTIGLNEVALGITVPLYWMRVMCATIGQREAERLLFKGELVTSTAALELGLIDALCSSSELLSLAETELQHRLKLPDQGRILCKQRPRADLSLAWEQQWQEEAQMGWKDLNSEAAIQTLGQTLQRLKGGKGHTAGSSNPRAVAVPESYEQGPGHRQGQGQGQAMSKL